MAFVERDGTRSVALRRNTRGEFYVDVRLEGVLIKDVLIDSGATCALGIPARVMAAAGVAPTQSVRALTANGAAQFRTGRGRVSVGGASIDGGEIMENLGGAESVLGTGFLRAFHWSLDAQRCELTLRPAHSLLETIGRGGSWDALARAACARWQGNR